MFSAKPAARMTTIVLGTLLVTVAATTSAVEITAQAVPGEPFGVASVQLKFADTNHKFSFTNGNFHLQQKNGRALYVAYQDMYDRWNPDPEERLTSLHFYFLFPGIEDFDLVVYTPEPTTVHISPAGDRTAHQTLKREWWQAFTSRSSFRYGDEADVSPLVDNYLASMLARRLQLDYQRLNFGWGWNHDLDEAFGLLLGTESVRAAMQKDRMLTASEAVEPADQRLPQGAAPPPLELPRAPADLALEPIARHVPHESLYIRFGSFENFQWFRSTLDDWGSDLRNLTSVRGTDYGIGPRLERQLGLKETALSKIFGPQVIEDVAIVGFDTFVREGSSLGFIFQAKNSFLLQTSLTQQRTEAQQRTGAQETKERIADHDVSLIATADNQMRSFYVADGDYHLVTNSRTLVRRFLEAGAGQKSLGQADEFRVARMLFPLTRQDSAFVYLSDEFFRNLVGPQYRVEMTRRMQAQTDLELIELAKLAAQAERRPGTTIEQLIAADLLPKHFGARVDGSRAVAAGDRFVDSLRGARGTFLPVADVPIDKITKSERQAYEEFERFYRSQWERVDPVAVGIRKQPGAGPRRETITLDIHIAPFAKARYGLFTNFLAPATKDRPAPSPDDLVSLQVRLNNLWWSGNDNRKPCWAFAGLRDHAGEFVVRYGHAYPKDADQAKRETPFYVGGNRDGAARWLYNPDQLEFDENGISKTRPNDNDPWALQTAEYFVLSPQRKLLESLRPQLKIVEAERPAQLRLHIGDLANAKLAPLVNAETYLRGRRVSHGNTRFLHDLALQFPIPREDCRAVAEKLLDAKLVCSLGGEYKFVRTDGRLGKWTSTLDTAEVRENEPLTLPAAYQPPPMNWFRGLDLEFSIGTTALDVHAELQVERKAP